MNPSKRCVALAALLFLTLAVTTAQAGDDWSTDWNVALAQAKAENKDILIDFSGTDWCGWCIRLKREVFSKDEFKNEAPKHFVIFVADFLRKRENMVKQDPKVRAQIMQLIQEFAVKGFPSVFLLDSQGRPYARTGYQRGGPEKYVAHLLELQKSKVERDELLAKAADATGLEKAKLLKSALNTVKDYPVYPFYASVAEEILKNDPDDSLGMKDTFADAREKYEDGLFMRKLMAPLREASTNPDADYKALFAVVDGLAREVASKPEKLQNALVVRAQLAWIQSDPRNQENRDVEILVKGYEKAIKAAPQSNAALGPKGLKVQLSRFKKAAEQKKQKKSEDS
jgi:thioredoxin-related protein